MNGKTQAALHAANTAPVSANVRRMSEARAAALASNNTRPDGSPLYSNCDATGNPKYHVRKKDAA